MSDRILVNSQFTLTVFKSSFPWIESIPHILYPSLHLPDFPFREKSKELSKKSKKVKFILSINRFERKKNVELALNAFLHLKQLVSIEEYNKLKLIIAGKE